MIVSGLAVILAACAGTPTPKATPPILPTIVPTKTPAPTPTPRPIAIYAQGSLPDSVRSRLDEVIKSDSSKFTVASDPSSAGVQIGYTAHADVPVIGQWVFAVVAPFPTAIDDVPWSAVQAAWHGQPIECDGCVFTDTLKLTDSTLQALKSILGDPAPNAIEVVPSDQLTQKLWDVQPALGIVPFNELNIRLKVLSVDGLTPIHRNLDLNTYPLIVNVGLAGSIESADAVQKSFGQAITNRDESKMTILAMTGVTAMSRDFAASMDANGVLYPDKLIKDYFTTSDIVHISNEVSFDPDCPKQPTINRGVFCSDPKYMDLLADTGVKIIELTGNHLDDYGWEPLSYTLGVYENLGIPYFGGGRTITEAQRLVTLTDHGNTIGFVGCNPVGPTIGWVDGLNDGRPGSAPCSSPYPTMQDEIKAARAAGTVVIATLQYYEQPLGDYSIETAKVQADDFAILAEAGANVVSGSQGHSIQGFGIKGNTFIHYGVGNLFFDQMQAINLRQNFIDRYVIVNNQLLSVELLTTIRDESALPRPMTTQERRVLLTDLFAVSNWGK
jgi:poly-gamma-glutamate synthesis protein (capsule biosynthesis protein)